MVVVYDVGIDGDVPFLVMECLPGTTLADEIRPAPLTIPRTTTIAGAILDALGAAHERGVLHRDLKPANVLIAADGHAKLTDFGIATSDTLLELTAAGMVIGTPAYLAPERLAGKRATVRSDLYAVGIMIYEALAGARPFRGDTPIALAYAMQHTSPEALCGRRDDVPEMLEAVVMRSIRAGPRTDLRVLAEFAAALRTAADDRPVRTDEHATVAIAPITATQLMTTVSAPDRGHSRTESSSGASARPDSPRRRACDRRVGNRHLCLRPRATRAPRPSRRTQTVLRRRRPRFRHHCKARSTSCSGRCGREARDRVARYFARGRARDRLRGDDERPLERARVDVAVSRDRRGPHGGDARQLSRSS